MREDAQCRPSVGLLACKTLRPSVMRRGRQVKNEARRRHRNNIIAGPVLGFIQPSIIRFHLAISHRDFAASPMPCLARQHASCSFIYLPGSWPCVAPRSGRLHDLSITLVTSAVGRVSATKGRTEFSSRIVFFSIRRPPCSRFHDRRHQHGMTSANHGAYRGFPIIRGEIRVYIKIVNAPS